MEQSGVAEMNVHVTGGGLEQNVRPDRRRLRVFRVAQNGARERRVVGGVIGSGSGLGGLFGVRPLRQESGGSQGQAQNRKITAQLQKLVHCVHPIRGPVAGREIDFLNVRAYKRSPRFWSPAPEGGVDTSNAK